MQSAAFLFKLKKLVPMEFIISSKTGLTAGDFVLVAVSN